MEELGNLPVVRSREEANIDYIVNWAKEAISKKNNEVWAIAWKYCQDNKMENCWPAIVQRVMDLS